jgi:HPt (histidine-containing phosphotransfer) domain-containing protein
MTNSDPEPASGHGAPRGDPVIDLAGGVGRVMGDHGLYARVLERFRSDYRRAAASIRGALAAGDLTLAERLTHTLKGAAGMIEARPLQRQALALEHALRGRREDCERQLDLLDTELDRVLRELDSMLTMPVTRESVPASSSLDPQHAAARLAALLDLGDGSAVELMQEAREALVAALGEARFAQVAAAIGEFDFERALELVNEAAA